MTTEQPKANAAEVLGKMEHVTITLFQGREPIQNTKQCPWCSSFKGKRHRPDCRLAAALAASPSDEITALRAERDAALAKEEGWRKLAYASAQIAEGATATAQSSTNLAEALQARVKVLEEALQPFGIAGRLIDVYQSKQPEDATFQSGCAWQENYVKQTLTWGDLRRARAALSQDRTDVSHD